MNNDLTTVTVHAKAMRAAFHDITPTMTVPAAIAASPAAMLDHLGELNPGVLPAACTEDTVDRISDVQVLDVLSVHTARRPTAQRKGRHDDA
ncbi:hypothetical protein [Streptomyces sp. NPDC020667]|uniref:hypothetical protein n=1 Tax=Streptomyces sp. NPDC020667 TaxID=3154895 RepID=UPI0033E30DFD